LRTADEMRLGAWLAEGSSEPRPQPGPATQNAETRVAVLATDAAAARAALPAAEQMFQRHAETVRTLQQRRDEAICAAAVEAAHKFAAGYLLTLTAALEREALLRGLRDELAAWGNRAGASPAALAAAAQVSDVIAATKRSATAALNPGAGRRLIEALAADPDAEL
jgi:aminopeptidase N